jgi:hypothetical protein
MPQRICMRGARSAWPTPTEPCAQDEGVWSVQRGSRATIWATRVGDGVGPFAWVPADLSYGDRQARRSSIWRASREGVSPQRTTQKARQGDLRSHSLPLLTYSALGGLRQDPGRAAESSAGPRTDEDMGATTCVCCCRRTRDAVPDRWDWRGGCGRWARRCGCARRPTGRSGRPTRRGEGSER